MFLTLSDVATTCEHTEQQSVNALVERSKCRPFLQIAQRLLVCGGLHELLQQCDMISVKPSALRSDPAVESRTAVDLHAFEKVASDRCDKCTQPLLTWHRRIRSHGGNRGGIDEAIRHIEPHAVGRGTDPWSAGFVDQPPHLAKAPPQFAPRIVGNFPQQLAKPATGNRVWRKQQVGEQTAHFA